MQTEPWWPTKTTFPLSSYAGSEACLGCHADEGAAHRTAMTRAASPAADSPFLAAGPHTTAHFSAYSWTLAGHNLTVAQGDETHTEPIAWDFGAGDLAHTFLYVHESRWYQSQVTFYTRTRGLDTTTGFNTLGDVTLETALGQRLSSTEARKCFACHTVHSTTSAGFNPAQAEAGVGCEGCHGPGRVHVDRMKAQSGTQAESRTGTVASHAGSGIFNPASLSPVDAIDFCGACHRTSVDASLAAGSVSLGTATVRFQPYRLQQSKCWRATQSASLSCTACHNPHEPQRTDTAGYDRTCLQCHARISQQPAHDHAVGLAAAPGVAQDRSGSGSGMSCVGCHMPKVEVASMHGSFTDHRIRIVKSGERFPE